MNDLTGPVYQVIGKTDKKVYFSTLNRKLAEHYVEGVTKQAVPDQKQFRIKEVHLQ